MHEGEEIELFYGLHVGRGVSSHMSGIWSPINSQQGEGVTAHQQENKEKKKKDGGDEERRV